jgi:DNA-binding NtrC family response regulator
LAAGDERLPANEWILIVDDEFDIISIFKQAFKKNGFHVFGFTDPLLALEHFGSNKRQTIWVSDL